ncbi:uncharacterized protein LOC123543028 [Mercenaria mercenaria]|uniref:uncharacterized protein LOC123543028 n=1 Tax=Mercenaria mercenaria TaxID=6596 RepID=UPI00234E7428|nr:uncharacterized protein LOC123543028 [Mercenaria mercenaria]
MCDIQEMYLQVSIKLSDRPFHSFLWRSSFENEPEVYQFNRLVFGVNASPFLAQCVSQYNAQCFTNEFPLAAETVLKSTYMDDSMDSVSNEEEGIELYRELSGLWQKASMYARKWLSNSQTVLEQIPKRDRAYEIDLSKSELPSVKTIGVLWKAATDIFAFCYNAPDSTVNFTKRSLLSKIATVYDPLGFLTPYTVRAKILMQETWLNGTDWNENLSIVLNTAANEWFQEMKELKKVTIPRCIYYSDKVDEIHVFVDASEKAYGTVAYNRSIIEGNPMLRFISAKSKVTTLTTISIPRLELMAACLGLNLAQNICKSLETNVNLVTFWPDSTNVLWWIRGQSRRYKPFVANRVGMIHSVTAPEQWFYVPTAENPADLASRGLSITELSESKLWWTGPKFLMLQKEHWPKKDFVQSDEAKTELKRKSMSSDCEFYQFFTEDRANAVLEEDRLDPIRYSSWSRFVHVFTWVNRFIDNCQLTEQERRKSGLLVEEIKSSKMQIIKKAQMESFKEDYQSLLKGRELSSSSKILALNPKLDEEGVMRSDSRLKFHEYLPYDVRFPIILPRQNWITKLIIKHFHEQNKHCGTNQTLSAKYWIISAREEIRKVENDCYKCRRQKAKAAQQIMGPLPEFRLGKSMQAFSETAADFAGPFLTKQGRGKSKTETILMCFHVHGMQSSSSRNSLQLNHRLIYEYVL